MKLRNEKRTIEKSKNIIESTFGISEKDSAHILSILRDKLYSNKILAIVREYCTNAQDAHAEVGKSDVPIKITLPTQLDSNLKIRDFGPGLSEEDVRNIYVMYGASTRRNTNNAVGSFGLGCKSAFSYSDMFHVSSWQNGEKKTYCAYIDESNKGKIALLNTENSDEDDGIEVQIPIKRQDERDIHRTVLNFARYLVPIPEIKGTTEKLELPKYWFERTLSSGARFGLTGSWSSNKVIMGGVAYPISANTFRATHGDYYDKMLDMGVHIYVNIGDVDITASREDLEYTDYTIQTVKGYLDEIGKIVIDSMENEITNTMTFREANIKYNQAKKNCPILKTAMTNYVWEGIKVNGLILPDAESYEIYYPYSHGKGNRWYDRASIEASEEIILFDIDNQKNWKQRITEFISYHDIPSRDIRAIKWKGIDPQKTREKVYARRQLHEWRPYKVSECKIPKELLAQSNRTKNFIRSTTHIGKIFTLKELDKRKRTGPASANWDRVTEVPDGKKYYIILDRFKLYFDESVHLDINYYDFDKVIEYCNKVGANINLKNIYGVKKAQVQKLNSDWIPFKDYAKEILENSNLFKQLADYLEYQDKMTGSLQECLKHNIQFPKNSIANDLINTIKILEANRSKLDWKEVENIKSLAKLLSIKIPASSLKIDPLLTVAKKRYPLAATTGIFPGSRYQDIKDISNKVTEILPHLIEYVDMMEKKQKGQTNE